MSENKSMVKDLTEGSVPKLLLSFAAPLFVSNALQAIYNIVDMIVVGQVIGGTGMSAVATGGNILHILTFLAMGFSSAGQVIIAREVGSKDDDALRKTIGTMFTLLLSMALGVSIICYFLRFTVLDLVNTPVEAYQYTMDYTVICIIGLIFIYGYNVVSAIMRGMGDSKRPFMFVGIAAVMNMILDIVFVAYMGMEVAGAAWATVIGQGFSFLFSVYYLYNHKDTFGFDFKPASFIPDKRMMKRIFALGIPMALQSAAISISQTVVAAWVNSFGVIYSAIAGILGKINMMMGIMSNAVTTACASMVGQNLGAKKYDRVPQILAWGFAGTLVLAIICAFILKYDPELIFSFFTTDAAVLAQASIIILPAILNFIGAASRCLGFGIINGSGNSKLNLAVAIIDGVIGRIGIAYILGWLLAMGPKGFWLGDALAGFMPCVIGMAFYMSGKWKRD
ncbi:MAG: MATE family efflux transporter [Erysipelotrichaceae bacterium]|nr:MATE family efflux transporter [Erysipelotrichaceae bacterium]